jgi:hypothetical protein
MWDFFSLVYGRNWLRYLSFLHGWGDPLWLLLPSCGAYYLYSSSLSSASLFAGRYRGLALVACSTAATLFSLYLGVFLSLNTYGE